MADEFKGQVEETPVEIPAATEPQSQAIDYTVLENEAAQLGDGITLSNLPGQHRAAIQGMNTAQTELAEIKKKYESAILLQDRINADPALGEHLTDGVKGYYAGEGQAAPKQVTQAVDPSALRVNQLEHRLENIVFDNQINALRDTYGKENLDQNIVDEINRRIVSTGVNDAKMHFMAVKGEEIISQKMKEASTQTAEQIAKNTQAYNVNQGGSAPASKPVKVGDLPDKEWSDALDDELEKMVGEGPMI